VIQRAGDKPAYDIPFPFEALVRRVEERADARPRRSCIQQILIPLGRSLQRGSCTGLLRIPARG
jgi:hypothetical protein